MIEIGMVVAPDLFGEGMVDGFIGIVKDKKLLIKNIILEHLRGCERIYCPDLIKQIINCYWAGSDVGGGEIYNYCMGAMDELAKGGEIFIKDSNCSLPKYKNVWGNFEKC